MINNLKHYGKNIDDLNEKEKKLLYIDSLLTSSLFIESILDSKLDINTKHNKRNLELCEKRTHIISEILGLDGDMEEIMNKIEETKFSYKKFVIDMRNNQNKVIEFQRKIQLN